MEPAEIARVRFVSERFRELQGIRGVITNLSVIPMFWANTIIDPPTAWGPLGVVLFMSMYLLPAVGAYASRVEADKYYARYGRVSAHRSRLSAEAVAVPILLGALSIDMGGLRSGNPSAVLIAGALISAHLVFRDWPWRRHHLIGVAGCAIGAALTATVPAMRIDTLPDLLRISFSVILGLGAVTAYFDHLLLVRILGPARDGTQDADVPARVE